jgi:folylpolyglutamate synthase/dihydropteroate synthase
MTGLEKLLTFPRFGAAGVPERMERLTDGLEMVPSIKVVGSNGKGSTAHMMADMAFRLGKKVGLYTSPHLLRVGERIRVNGKEIPERDLNYILNWAISKAEGIEGVGRFELLTLAALYHFAQSEVDVAIMEVGLGGRYDPVRISPGRYSVLTSIDLEHTAILGDTIEDIAGEKAAVCNAGETLISAVSGIKECLPEDVELIETAHPPLDPLQSNARLAAVAISQHFNLDHLPDVYSQRLAGRLHKLSATPPVYVDVAHSPKAVQTVLDALGDKPISLVIAARTDKDIANMPGHYEHIIALQFGVDMCSPEQILENMKADRKDTAETVEEALNIARDNLAEDGIILCLGGFGLAGRVIAHMRGLHYDVISL